MIDSPVWDRASKLIALNLEPLLKYFQIDFNRCGNRYSFPCPLHDGDRLDGACLYNNKSFIIFNCFTNCPRDHRKDGLHFIKGLLSRSAETSYTDTIKFVYDFIEEKIPTNSPRKDEFDKYWFLNISDEVPQIHGELITKEQVRSRLMIPSKYYLNRGFDLGVLDSYDVGECLDKTKKFYNRAVIPCYDEEGTKYIGATGRSIFEQCPKCKYHHHESKMCPADGYSYFKCSKWLHDGLKSSSVLFNFWGAREEIKRTHKVILTEGPMDCLALYSLGIKNVVSLFGNFLKDGQAALLDSCGAMDLILMLDNDPAGIKGSTDIKQKYSRMYRIYMPLYKGKDPGVLQTDVETEDIKRILAQIGQ